MTETNTGSSGYGQQDPTVGNEDFNVVAFQIRQMMRKMETNRLVQVKAIHPGEGSPPAQGTVDVLPLVQQIDGNGNVTKHGTVYGIPVLRLQGGTSAIIMDPAVDDIGYVSVCNRDGSIVKSKKTESPPGSFRAFDLADGIYTGRLFADAPNQYVWFGEEKVTIADAGGNMIVLDSAGITATDKFGHVLRMKSTGFDLTGNLTVSGTITAVGGISLTTHTHISGGSGSPTGPPLP
jgi:hypothetical protein